MLSFMGTIKPIALDRIPDENGDIPALQKKRQNDAPMEMNQQTRDWLDAMANRQVRYGPIGRLALEVLPEGVQGDHPEVRSMLKDIERGPSAKKQVSL